MDAGKSSFCRLKTIYLLPLELQDNEIGVSFISDGFRTDYEGI